MQPQYNLLYREEEREMLPLCLDQGVGVIPWSPLARGRLTRDWHAETNRSQHDPFARTMHEQTEPQDRAIVDAVSRVAEQIDVPRAQVALAWMMTKPSITSPIVGVTKPQHLADAIAALAVSLTGQQIDALEAPYVARAVNGVVAPASAEPPKLTRQD